ncbi:MAG TPA: alkane 1-monooxygenase [Solirubrobacterales bacterium]|nr:alkane 1-monooxygenase [Solirubrobacterales bacterium]
MEAHAEHAHHHHHHEHVDVNPAAWTDGKRYAWLLGIIVPLSPFLAWFWVSVTGFGGMWFLGPVLVFGLFPLLDMAIGRDPTNPPDSVLKFLEQDRYYRWCTYVFIPIQYAGLVFACWMWSSGDLSLVENVGLALTMAVVGGIAINTAHELGHKRASSEKWLSRVALAQTGYGHFFIEHNRGHHVKVATPEDPASSRLGEGFWAFLPRTVIGSLRSAWGIETARLDRLGKSHWSIHNDVLSAWAMTVVLFAGLAIAFGPVVLPYLLLQAAIGFSLLEVVNYLEHYGLLRQKREDGRYERCLPEHSWNSNNVASNVLLYHLQRHSDHHANPTRRYQALRHVDEAPQLPTGYAGMIVLAWFPPLWRRVMDPRLLEHYEGDVTKANIHPRKLGRVLERYGRPA